jgi:hypothetical protein
MAPAWRRRLREWRKFPRAGSEGRYRLATWFRLGADSRSSVSSSSQRSRSLARQAGTTSLSDCGQDRPFRPVSINAAAISRRLPARPRRWQQRGPRSRDREPMNRRLSRGSRLARSTSCCSVPLTCRAPPCLSRPSTRSTCSPAPPSSTSRPGPMRSSATTSREVRRCGPAHATCTGRIAVESTPREVRNRMTATPARADPGTGARVWPWMPS